MLEDNHKFSDLTGIIIGCAIEVHNYIGCGFQEIIYQRALSIELCLQGIPHEVEKEIVIFYKGCHIGTRRADFFVEEKIMLEIKAVKELENVHLAQAINYLEAYRMEVGLLINFGSTRLQFKRLMKPLHRPLL